MQIYGYTRVCSEGGINGKESETVLFTSKDERNRIMYEDYSDTFDIMVETGDFEKRKGIGFVDDNGNPKQTKKEFMKELQNSEDIDHDVFGLIQASDFHTQYEPFCKMLN